MKYLTINPKTNKILLKSGHLLSSSITKLIRVEFRNFGGFGKVHDLVSAARHIHANCPGIHEEIFF